MVLIFVVQNLLCWIENKYELTGARHSQTQIEFTFEIIGWRHFILSSMVFFAILLSDFFRENDYATKSEETLPTAILLNHQPQYWPRGPDSTKHSRTIEAARPEGPGSWPESSHGNLAACPRGMERIAVLPPTSAAAFAAVTPGVSAAAGSCHRRGG